MSWTSIGMVLLVGVVAACGGDVESAPEAEASPVTEAANGPEMVRAPEGPAEPLANPAPANAEPGRDPSGFPCEVSVFLQRYCAACHTGNYPPSYYRVSTFKSRDDLLAVDSAGKTLGQHAVERMTIYYEPMPPADALLQPLREEVEVIARWVDDGMPSGPCGPLTGLR